MLLIAVQVYDYVFLAEEGDKGQWVPWMSTTEKYVVDPNIQFNEVSERKERRRRIGDVIYFMGWSRSSEPI